MPWQPKRPCSYPGCPKLTTQGRCDKHKSERTARDIERSKQYGSAWTRLRNRYIRDNPVCEIQEICNGDPAIEVDHIVALAHGGERLDEDNIQSTCRPCHRWKTRHVDGFTGAHDTTNLY